MYIDPIFNSYKVKYVLMDKLFKKLKFNDERDKMKIDTVNIFINLESVMLKMHREYIEDSLHSLNKEEYKETYLAIISNIINLAAHYRKYFSKYKIKTNIFYYYNEFNTRTKYYNLPIIPNYRKYYYDKMTGSKYSLINELFREGIKFANTIIDYIQQVYFLSSDSVESSCIPLYVVNENIFPSNMNIIVSNDIYDMQYVNHNFVLIYPYKEESVILNKQNLLDFLKRKYECDIVDELSPLLINFFISVMGDKKRNLDKIKGIGFKKLYKELIKLYKKGFIDIYVPSTLKIHQLLPLIKSRDGIFDTEYQELVASNYQCIDIERQIKIAHKTSLSIILDNIIDKIDTRSLKDLNDRIFDGHPLELEELNA